MELDVVLVVVDDRRFGGEERLSEASDMVNEQIQRYLWPNKGRVENPRRWR